MSSSQKESRENTQSYAWRQGKYIYKTAITNDRVTLNEISIGQDMARINHPNICEFIGVEYNHCYLEPCENEDALVKKGDVCSSKEIVGQTLFRPCSIWKFVDGVDLYTIMADDHVSDIHLWALIQQVLCCLLELQEKLGFIHGDLHFGNILVEPTNMQKITYSISGLDIQVETFGRRAVLIDFGNSACWKSGKIQRLVQPLFWSTNKSDIGCTFTMPSDMWNDIRNLFCTFSFSSQFDRRNICTEDMFYLTRTLFRTNISLDSGQPNPKNTGFIEEQFEWINMLNKERSVWIHKNPELFWRALASMTILPLTTSDHVPATLWNEEDGLMLLLINEWIQVEKYLTIEQAGHVFDTLVEACFQKPATKESEGNFAQKLHECLAQVGQTTISFDLEFTTRLFYIFCTVGELMSENLAMNMLPFLEEMLQVDNDNEMLLTSIHPNWQIALIALFGDIDKKLRKK